MLNLEERIQKSRSRSLAREILDFGNNYIDYKMGLVGAAIMGSTVFGINYYETNDILGSTTAAMKQAGYTFFFGGSVMKLCKYLATSMKKEIRSLVAAVIIPSMITLSLTYGMHSLKGTPKPLESTIPTALVIPATVIVGYNERKKNEKNFIFKSQDRNL